MSEKQKNLGARLALVVATLIWGSSFVLMKSSLDVFPTFLLLAIRFSIGAVLIGAIRLKKLIRCRVSDLWRGAVIGLLLFAAYAFQTLGLVDTTPGKNAFLTAIYCVTVPFLDWVVTKRRPGLSKLAAALLCLIGIGLVSLTVTDGLSINRGDLLTLIGGLFFAAHIVAVNHLGRGRDPFCITAFQFGSAAVCGWILFFLFETLPAVPAVSDWLWLLYLGVFPTAVALLLQNVGLTRTPPAAASILLSLESVFGVLFSILFYPDETLTVRIVCGFALIFFSILLAEWTPGKKSKKTV